MSEAAGAGEEDGMIPGMTHGIAITVRDLTHTGIVRVGDLAGAGVASMPVITVHGIAPGIIPGTAHPGVGMEEVTTAEAGDILMVITARGIMLRETDIIRMDVHHTPVVMPAQDRTGQIIVAVEVETRLRCVPIECQQEAEEKRAVFLQDVQIREGRLVAYRAQVLVLHGNLQ